MNGYGTPGFRRITVAEPHERREATILPFEPVFVGDLQGIQPAPLEWIVPGALMKGEVTLFAGATKLGKTYLCQHLMTAGALGDAWLGHDLPQFASFGLFAEDRNAVLHTRQRRINDHYGVDHHDIGSDISWLSRESGNARLCEFDRFSSVPILTKRFHDLREHCLDCGVRLVVLDTAARVFGGNENDRNQVTAFVEVLAALAYDVNGAVILNAHPNRSGGWYSGTSAWESTVRVTMSIERPPNYDRDTGENDDVRMLYGMGSNYGPKLAATKLRWDNGIFVAEEIPQRKRSLTAQEQRDLDYRMLAGLKRLISNGAAVPADSHNTRSLPSRAKKDTRDFASWPKVWLIDSVNRLLAGDQIKRVLWRNVVVLRPAEMTLPGEKEWQEL